MSKDKVVVASKQCRDCGVTFDITQGERDFYKEKGWPEPARCKQCRMARKAERKTGGSNG